MDDSCGLRIYECDFDMIIPTPIWQNFLRSFDGGYTELIGVLSKHNAILKEHFLIFESMEDKLEFILTYG